MSLTPTFDANSVLSFRNLLTETTSEFLSVRQMSSPDTAEALGELIVALATYKEEGLPLFPQVFLLDDTNDIIVLKGFDMRQISRGNRSRETMRRALKQCAPLCRGGWSIYFDLSVPHEFTYGLFRTDNSILASTPMERLRAAAEPHCKILGISRLAENVIELSASTGYRKFIHLSGARTDVPHPTVVVEQFVRAVTADVRIPEGAFWAASVPTFFRHVFYDVMQAPYGCLAMVVPASRADLNTELLSDGVILAPQIDVISAIRSYYEDPCGSNATALQSVATLLKGMLSADGITVLRSDASLIGYNVFVRHHTLQVTGAPIGGARLRSYNVLCQHVGQDLTAAFYRSQDGVALCDTVFVRQAQQVKTQEASPLQPPVPAPLNVQMQAPADSQPPQTPQAIPSQIPAQAPLRPSQMMPTQMPPPAFYAPQRQTIVPQAAPMPQMMPQQAPAYAPQPQVAPAVTPAPFSQSYMNVPQPQAQVQIQSTPVQAPMAVPQPQQTPAPMPEAGLMQPVAIHRAIIDELLKSEGAPSPSSPPKSAPPAQSIPAQPPQPQTSAPPLPVSAVPQSALASQIPAPAQPKPPERPPQSSLPPHAAEPLGEFF